MTGNTGLFVARDGSNNGTTPKGARLALGGLFAHDGSSPLAVRKGVLYDDGTAVVSGTAAMSYSIRAHVVVTMASTTNGPTALSNDADLVVTTDPAPGANSRIDIIYVRQRLVSGDGGSESVNTPEYGVAKGGVAASPSAPSLPTGAIELARATVTAGTTATTALAIQQTHAWTVANGAPVPVRTGAERDALAGRAGMRVIRLDRGGRIDQHNGTGWSPIRTAGARTQNTTSSGDIVVSHGGGWVPVSVQCSGRNSGWSPYLLDLDATSATFRFLNRVTGAVAGGGLSMSFDWACDFFGAP